MNGMAVANPDDPKRVASGALMIPGVIENGSAVAVFWRRSLKLAAIPGRPTFEGVLRLGNRDVGPVIVAITLQDATPVYPQRE